VQVEFEAVPFPERNDTDAVRYGLGLVPIATVPVAGLPRPLQLEVHGAHDKHISTCLLDGRAWEPLETELIRRFTGPGELLLDCGANIGWYSVLAAVNGAEVVAFEPMPTNAALLRSNIALNDVTDRVVVHEVAASDHRGTAELAVSTDNQGDHRLVTGQHLRSTVTVPLLPVDDVFDRRPSVIKLDTQGSEVPILRGARRAWSPNGVDDPVLVIEFWPYGLTRCGHDPDELVAMIGEMVPATHAAFEIVEFREHLRPVSHNEIAEFLNTGGYTVERRGFTNLALIPHRHLAVIDDLT
jgi:FkbM family methyltransferase